ncbi:MAG: hypothetical protein H0U20_08595 [Thermoleophilaceae bacterium]|nr:hypothetical protein [Thermoleophilaceae bacterium]
MIGRCGQSALQVQLDEPVWRPLVKVVGERLAGAFMWMHEDELEDGSSLHAYKHIHTRRYLYLTEHGRAYQWAPCGRFVPTRLDYALQSALCTWWLLRGWDKEDAAEVRRAIAEANKASASSHER